MARQTALFQLPDVAEAALAAPRDIDYDAHYAVLDLAAGAPLREVEDRGRLLRVSFDPAGLPPALMVLAAERFRAVERAVDALSDYWRTHGVPPLSRRPGVGPPPRRASDPDNSALLVPRLAAALAEALAAEIHVAGRAQVAHLLPSRRRPANDLPGSASAVTGASRPAIGELAPRLGSAPLGAVSALPPRADPPPHGRRRRKAAALLFNAAMIALVIAAAFRLYQYRALHPELGAAATQNPAAFNAMPSAPAARWSGSSQRSALDRAAAPAIAGRRSAD